MTHTNLTCNVCNAQLNNAFLGKANSRGWDKNELACSIEHGNHVLPTEE